MTDNISLAPLLKAEGMMAGEPMKLRRAMSMVRPLSWDTTEPPPAVWLMATMAADARSSTAETGLLRLARPRGLVNVAGAIPGHKAG